MAFSGCILLEGVAVADAEMAGEMAMGEDAAETAGRYGARISNGRFVLANEEAAYSLYDDVRLTSAAGENPKLYVPNSSKPIGEVLTNERRIRLMDGREYRVEKNIFAVTNDGVNVRVSPSVTSKVIDQVRQGQMIVSLGEVDEGWYKVEIIKNKVRQIGFVKGSFLTPIIIVDSNATGYSDQELATGTVPYPSEEQTKSDLVSNGMPGGYLSDIQDSCVHFRSLDEIKSYRESVSYSNGLFKTVDVVLENADGDKCQVHSNISYGLLHGKWKCQEIRQYGNFTYRALGTLYVGTNDNSLFGMAIDLSGLYGSSDPFFRLTQIKTGTHLIRIYENRADNNARALLYEGRVEVYSNKTTSLTFNPATGTATISHD